MKKVLLILSLFVVAACGSDSTNWLDVNYSIVAVPATLYPSDVYDEDIPANKVSSTAVTGVVKSYANNVIIPDVVNPASVDTSGADLKFDLNLGAYTPAGSGYTCGTAKLTFLEFEVKMSDGTFEEIELKDSADKAEIIYVYSDTALTPNCKVKHDGDEYKIDKALVSGWNMITFSEITTPGTYDIKWLLD